MENILSFMEIVLSFITRHWLSISLIIGAILAILFMFKHWKDFKDNKTL